MIPLLLGGRGHGPIQSADRARIRVSNSTKSATEPFRFPKFGNESDFLSSVIDDSSGNRPSARCRETLCCPS